MIITDIPNVLEVLPFVLEIEKENLLLVIVYHSLRLPRRLVNYIDDSILLLTELPT